MKRDELARFFMMIDGVEDVMGVRGSNIGEVEAFLKVLDGQTSLVLDQIEAKRRDLPISITFNIELFSERSGFIGRGGTDV